VYLRFVLLHPGKLGRRKISRRVQVAVQETTRRELRHSTVTNIHSPAVAPDDGVSQGTVTAIHDHQAVHLISDAYCSSSSRTVKCTTMVLQDSLLGMYPPCSRTLLRPPWPCR